MKQHNNTAENYIKLLANLERKESHPFINVSDDSFNSISLSRNTYFGSGKTRFQLPWLQEKNNVPS